MTPGNKVRSSEQLHSFPHFPGFGKNDPTPPRMEQLSLAGASWEKLEGRKEGRARDGVDPKGTFPEQTLGGFPWIPGKVGKLLLELLELAPDQRSFLQESQWDGRFQPLPGSFQRLGMAWFPLEH